MDHRDMIVGEIQKAMGATLGPSAAAVMRKAGMEASRTLWPELPSGVSLTEAGRILHDGIAELGSFGDFTIAGEEADGAAKIRFQGCYFASLAGEGGAMCGKQPICSFGFGMVEETLHRLTGRRTRVTLVEHDPSTVTCEERATPR